MKTEHRMTATDLITELVNWWDTELTKYKNATAETETDTPKQKRYKIKRTDRWAEKNIRELDQC